MRLWIGFAIVALATEFASGQDEVVIRPVRAVDGQGNRFNAAGAVQLGVVQAEAGPMPARQPMLQDAIQAKLTESEGKEQIVFLAQAFRDEVKKGQVVKMNAEMRTRTVVDANGDTVEQTYTFMVPVSSEEEVTTRVPAGKKPIAVPVDACSFYDIHNAELSRAQIAERLAELRTVILMDNTDAKPMKIDAIARDLLNPDTVVVVTKNVVREQIPLQVFAAQAVRGRALPMAPLMLPAAAEPANVEPPKP